MQIRKRESTRDDDNLSDAAAPLRQSQNFSRKISLNKAQLNKVSPELHRPDAHRRVDPPSQPVEDEDTSAPSLAKPVGRRSSWQTQKLKGILVAREGEGARTSNLIVCHTVGGLRGAGVCSQEEEENAQARALLHPKEARRHFHGSP
jgi:hypothetical protein